MKEAGATKSDQPKRVIIFAKGRMLVPQSFTGGRQNPQWNGRIGLDQLNRENREQGGFLECHEERGVLTGPSSALPGV